MTVAGPGTRGAFGRVAVLMNFGNPYLLQRVPEMPAYLVAWGGFPLPFGAGEDRAAVASAVAPAITPSGGAGSLH